MSNEMRPPTPRDWKSQGVCRRRIVIKTSRSSLTNVDFPHSESQRLNILEAGRDREDVYAQYVQPLQICKDIHGKAFR